MSTNLLHEGFNGFVPYDIGDGVRKSEVLNLVVARDTNTRRLCNPLREVDMNSHADVLHVPEASDELALLELSLRH